MRFSAALLCFASLPMLGCPPSSRQTDEDVTITIESDASDVEARLGQLQERAEALDAERTKLTEERAVLEDRLRRASPSKPPQPADPAVAAAPTTPRSATGSANAQSLEPLLREILSRLDTIEHVMQKLVGSAESPGGQRRKGSGGSKRIGKLGTSGGGNVTLGGKDEAKFAHDAPPTGSLSSSAVSSVVQKYRRDLRDCFEIEMQQDRSPSGKVVLDVIVNPDGAVRKAAVGSNSTRFASIGTCMARRAKRWRFPQPQGGPARVEVPIVVGGGS